MIWFILGGWKDPESQPEKQNKTKNNQAPQKNKTSKQTNNKQNAVFTPSLAGLYGHRLSQNVKMQTPGVQYETILFIPSKLMLFKFFLQVVPSHKHILST